MYEVEFYETADGKSELWDFLEELRIKSCTNKDDTFVLLYHFRKNSQKTPRREIERAKAERADYLFQKEDLL